MHDIHIIDIGIVVIYLIICIMVGLRKSKSIKTLKQYTLGGRNFPNIVIITTLFATHIGSTDTVGVVEQLYILGMFFAVALLFEPFFWLIMAKIYGSNIDQFHGCMSISDIMETLYGKIGRGITNVAAILISVAIVASSATAMGYIIYYFFQIPPLCGTIISVGVLALYSAFGGIRAVALTDVFQFAILIVAIPLACSFAYHDIGGYENVVKELPEELLTLNLNKDNIWLFLSLIFYSFLPQTGGVFIQRFLLSRNSIQLTQCIKIVAVIHLPFAVIMCLIGFIIRAKAPGIEPNTAFIYFIANYLYIGVKGLVIAGLLAVIMSSADSWLNTTSVLCAHDIVRKLIPLTEKQALLIARLSTFIIAILAVLLSFSEKGVMELEWLAGNFWEPLIIIPLTAGFLKFRTNDKSFAAATALAITFTCVSGYIVGDFGTISLMYGMIGNAIGLFGMHYWQKRHGIDPAAKYKLKEARRAKRKSKVIRVNSREQIDAWYKESMPNS